jgi:hypothetical protein
MRCSCLTSEHHVQVALALLLKGATTLETLENTIQLARCYSLD